MRGEPQSLKLNSYERRALRDEIAARDGAHCRSCGAADALELDHISPLWKLPEGALDRGNLQLLCGPCHRAKTGLERKELLAHRWAQP